MNRNLNKTLCNFTDTYSCVVSRDILVSLLYSNRHRQCYLQCWQNCRQAVQQLMQNSINVCWLQVHAQCKYVIMMMMTMMMIMILLLLSSTIKSSSSFWLTIIIRLKARLQPNIGFTLWRLLAAFMRLAITPPKVNWFGLNLEHFEYIVGGWPRKTLGAIRAVVRAGEQGEILFFVR